MTRKLLITGFILMLIILNSCNEAEPEPNLDPPDLLSPADGATIAQNPPTFIWGSVEGDTCDLIFRIEIATASNFDAGSMIISTMVPLTDTTYTPGDTFAADTYYWHMAVRQNA